MNEISSALEARHIHKSYSGHKALDDVSLAVPKQSVFGLLGPNGAGKTTLIRIINQITAPDSGDIFLHGKKLLPSDVERMAYLPEERGLYKKMKVGEQCMYLAQLKGLSKSDARQRLGEWFNRFDMVAWWDKKVEDLSKGMSQKVQFIISVVYQPSLLILDEPFSGFDPINAKIIREEMLRLKKEEGVTIILSTHDMGSVEALCDNIALINRSQVILKGSVAEIKDDFRSHVFEIIYDGYPLDLTISLGAVFELLKAEHDGKKNIAHIRLPADRELNDLLATLIRSVNIVSARELIPDFDQIFIKAVQSFNAIHHE